VHGPARTGTVLSQPAGARAM